MLVIIVLVIALAQRALRLRTEHAEYYRGSDVLLFGAMLSTMTAVVVVPAYALLQQSGQELTKHVLKAMNLPMNPDWFASRTKVLDALAPPLGPQLAAAGFLTVATPLIAAAFSAWLAARTDRSDRREAAQAEEDSKRPSALNLLGARPPRARSALSRPAVRRRAPDNAGQP